jgi:2-oxoglutarate ferredoxin oxidoreductase subunit alpha
LDLTVRLAGESGDGVILAGEILTYALSRMGLKIFTFRTYPSSIRGGQCMYQIRASDWHAYSQGDTLDLLVAFDTEAASSNLKDLKPDGGVIFDQDRIPRDDPTLPKRALGAPFTSIAKNELSFPKARNIIIAAYAAGTIGISETIMKEVITGKLGSRGEAVLNKNISATELGFKLVPKEEIRTLPTGETNKIVLSGNQAIVLGAIAAGCRFYGGYPITPASDILELLSDLLPGVGGRVFQGEDEITSIGAAIGASYAGTKAMTATSGPGFSLMTEMIGMASMAEIPVVIVDAQRGGPSTGLPTKTEQSDLNQAMFGGHGDVPRIVLAPGSVEDCFYQTIRAFNLAERYQLPVILLTDQSLAQCTEGVPLPDIDNLQIVNREKANLVDEGKFRRYAVTDNGVSPISTPGEIRGEYVAESAEHDERGRVNFTTNAHSQMTAKRFRKLETAERELADDPLNFTEVDDREAKLAVMGWGSTQAAIHEAVLKSKEKRIRVKWLQCKLLSPLPRKKINTFLEGVDHVVVPELNYTSQFANLLRMNFAIEPILITKTEGMPFTPGEIIRKIEELA